MGKLLPCPFCGGEARIKGKKISRVACSCTARTYGKTKEEAIAAWNRRTEQTSKKYVDDICALTARAEQAERERDALISSIERLRTKKIELCSICEFEDLIACCHKNHCEGYQLFKRRGLPQEGDGEE